MLAWLSISIVAIIHHITSDDQLPLLILVIVESPLTNVIAQVQFMDDFDFMHSRNNELEYGSFLFLIFSYCFASFSTAVDFLKHYKVQRKQFTLQPATRLSPTEDLGSRHSFCIQRYSHTNLSWASGISTIFFFATILLCVFSAIHIFISIWYAWSTRILVESRSRATTTVSFLYISHWLEKLSVVLLIRYRSLLRVMYLNLPLSQILR